MKENFRIKVLYTETRVCKDSYEDGCGEETKLDRSENNPFLSTFATIEDVFRYGESRFSSPPLLNFKQGRHESRTVAKAHSPSPCDFQNRKKMLREC